MIRQTVTRRPFRSPRFFLPLDRRFKGHAAAVSSCLASQHFEGFTATETKSSSSSSSSRFRKEKLKVLGVSKVNWATESANRMLWKNDMSSIISQIHIFIHVYPVGMLFVDDKSRSTRNALPRYVFLLNKVNLQFYLERLLLRISYHVDSF